MFSIIKKVDKGIERFATILLVLSVLSMLTLSSFSIVIRWFQYNITWIDPFLRHLVFFSTFLGGILATGQGTHIGIDILGKFVESRGLHKLKKLITQVIYIACIAVLGWLIKAGIDFTHVEMEFSKVEFWGLGSGYLVMLVPIGFTLLALRFVTMFFLSFQQKGEA